MFSRTAVAGSTAAVALVLLAACGGGDRAASESGTPAPGAAVASAPAAAGEQIYQQRCSSCHQPNGEGLAGVYPPLAGSEYTTGSAAVPIRVVIHGLQGAITVKGNEYNSLMPAYGVGIVMSDQEVADVVTYVRSMWGNSASAVTAAEVAAEREATKDHTGAMTAELLAPLLGR
jgi:mono/diheme cytochrome c family protein